MELGKPDLLDLSMDMNYVNINLSRNGARLMQTKFHRQKPMEVMINWRLSALGRME